MPASSLWQWALDPLRIGGAVYNRVRQETGSIGGFGRNGAGDVFLFSCAHVLLSPHAVASEPILPALPAGAGPIADADPAGADLMLDVAAAKLRPGIAWVAEAVGLGPIRQLPIAPVAGLRVCKMGAETLLTEGTIDAVGPGEFTIAVSAGFPASYELSDTGDSGALWLEIDTRAPVGIHRRGAVLPRSFAAAIPLHLCLAKLGLVWSAAP